jgi:triacylglycerol esterase/lipase EstA (alpha/beta hydrolase family)
MGAGWSQGGMMPRYYIDDLGGSQYVRRLVALAPSDHGSTAGGITNLLREFGLLGLVDTALAASCVACTEQVAGSSFLQALNAGGGTVPSIIYVNIASTHDDVVTPYTSDFLSGPNVQNITIQAQCPEDASGHLAVPYDSNILQDVVNALGADSSKFRPRCAATGRLSGNL